MVQTYARTLRVLWHRRGFAAAVVLTLALGIGANTTIFSVVNGVLLRPLPYDQSDRLVQIHTRQSRGGGDRLTANSIPDYLDWRDHTRGFDALAIFTTLDFNLPGDGRTEPLAIRVNFASSQLFEVLNASALIGRVLAHPEERPGGDLYTVILSHDLWRRRFGSDPAAIGRLIKLDTTPYRVVGVMRPEFRFPDNSDAWAPLESWLDRAKSTMRSASRDGRGYAAVGRVRSGLEAEDVRTDLERIATRLEQQHPQSNNGIQFVATPFRDAQVSDIRGYLPSLLGAAAFVFLISCANVINLCLARAGERRSEFAVRIALGAGRTKLMTELLAESLMLSLLGGALGVGVALVGVRTLHGAIPVSLPLWLTFDIDWRVWSYACMLAAVVGVAGAIVPALGAFHQDQDRVLREQGRGGGSRASRFGRSMLVISEVSLSLVLLIGAGLLFRSFAHLRQVDPGFRVDNLLVVYVSPPGDRYRETPPLPAYAALYERILERLRQLPGVDGAAGTRVIPYGGKGQIRMPGPITLEGQGTTEQERNPLARAITISHDYFAVAGVPLERGRPFFDGETQARPRVAIVSQALAKRLWPGDDPIGKRIKPGNAAAQTEWCTVVGVAGDVRYGGLHLDTELTVYYPFTQTSAGDFHFLVRTRGAPLDWADRVQQQIWSVDPDLAIYSQRTMTSILASSIWQQRLWAAVFSVFAVVAAALALIGIYGVLAWSVRQRTREIGIRMALGARREAVLALILKQGMQLALVGVVGGISASLILTRFLSSQLFGITATDPVTWLGVSLVLPIVCAVACYLPARRASRVDPVEVLKPG